MTTGPGAECGRRWWREAEVVWLLALVGAAYFSRAGELPLRGEEPTRAQIAFEMWQGGDWVVPREQGEPFRIRPPLQNWVIAASSLALGSWGAWAVRFPSLLATLLTALLVYGYGRTFLSRTGAMAAAAAFATLGEMFQMGRQAETEALFILLLSAALLVWHWGLVRRWPAAATWAAGYGLTALATLTKGMQAPLYFVGATGAYLVLTRQWRRLLSAAHLLGAALAVALLAAWAVPYGLRLGWPAVRTVWFGDPALRVTGWKADEVAAHLLTYPLEVAAGTLPWSALLLLYLRRDFRRSLGEARPQALFLTLCLAVAFPSCWLPPGGQPRFFAPLYPCLALLVGLAVQRCAAAGAASPWRAAWGWYLGVAAGVIFVAAAGVALSSLAGPGALEAWAEPLPVALAYAAGSVGLAAVVVRARAGAAGPRAAVLAVAAFLALTFTGVGTDVRLRRSEDASAAVRRLKERLPAGQPLVSLGGHTDSLFGYLYGLPLITPRPWPTNWGEVDEIGAFCFVWPGDSRPALPFAWEEVGAVSLDRNHHAVPERVVVVGRRLPAPRSRGAHSSVTPKGKP
jgi:4-amino-4-deoxy-L-arabinose transferase-like glycosyltransferase